MNFLNRMFFVAAVCALTFVSSAHAQQDDKKSCENVLKLASDLGCFNLSNTDKAAAEPQHYIINSDFGPTECKTRQSARDANRSHKGACTTWMKERKTELKDKYLTGTCNEECNPCGSPGMEKCSVKGVVHYQTK